MGGIGIVGSSCGEVGHNVGRDSRVIGQAVGQGGFVQELRSRETSSSVQTSVVGMDLMSLYFSSTHFPRCLKATHTPHFMLTRFRYRRLWRSVRRTGQRQSPSASLLAVAGPSLTWTRRGRGASPATASLMLTCSHRLVGCGQRQEDSRGVV